MKLTTHNVVLLVACFGIAFETRKLVNQNTAGTTPQPPISAEAPHLKRKQWLKSDIRKKMEAVAVFQGWVQYVDGTTNKRFWHCPITNESFHELVFVGAQSVRLNRWCRGGEDAAHSNGAQLAKTSNVIPNSPLPPPPPPLIRQPERTVARPSKTIPTAPTNTAAEEVKVESLPIAAVVRIVTYTMTELETAGYSPEQAREYLEWQQQQLLPGGSSGAVPRGHGNEAAAAAAAKEEQGDGEAGGGNEGEEDGDAETEEKQGKRSPRSRNSRGRQHRKKTPPRLVKLAAEKASAAAAGRSEEATRGEGGEGAEDVEIPRSISIGGGADVNRGKGREEEKEEEGKLPRLPPSTPLEHPPSPPHVDKPLNVRSQLVSKSGVSGGGGGGEDKEHATRPLTLPGKWALKHQAVHAADSEVETFASARPSEHSSRSSSSSSSSSAGSKEADSLRVALSPQPTTDHARQRAKRKEGKEMPSSSLGGALDDDPQPPLPPPPPPLASSPSSSSPSKLSFLGTATAATSRFAQGLLHPTPPSLPPPTTPPPKTPRTPKTQALAVQAPPSPVGPGRLKNTEVTSLPWSSSSPEEDTAPPLPHPNRKRSRPTFFLHLHKAAGTTLCELAVRNGQRAAGMRGISTKHLGFNCNLLGDDPGHLGLGVAGQESTYGQAEGKLSCKGRLELMARDKLVFTAAERWLFPTDLCVEAFVYVTCLRDPVKRIKSSVKFHKEQSEKLVTEWATKHEFFSHAPVSKGTPSVDNFYVRSFAGKDVFLKRLGQVTPADLEAAKAILTANFEVVLIVEQFSRDLVQLEVMLGWKSTALGNAKQSPNNRVVAFTELQEMVLTKRNALDFDFYKHADEMAKDISAKALVFKQGSKQHKKGGNKR